MYSKTAEAMRVLQKILEAGKIGKDGYLPSERKLCELLSVGRGSVRVIIAALLQNGSIEHIPGKGMHLGAKFNYGKKLRRMLVIRSADDNEGSEGGRILDGISLAAHKHDIEMVFALPKADYRLHSDTMIRVDAGEYDGIIYLETFDSGEARRIFDAGIPAVVANIEEKNAILSVGVDYRQIGRLAGRTLVENGHTNIGFIGKSFVYIYHEMLAGIKGALAEDDLSISPDKIIWIGADTEDFLSRLEKLLKSRNRPTALIAGRDYHAQFIYHICNELKLKIPQDISIIGYDDLTWKNAEDFGLTTIAQPALETGFQSVELLRQAVESTVPPANISLPGKLVQRRSIGRL